MKLARSPANLIAGGGFEPTASGLLARQVGTIQIVSNKMTFCYVCDESQFCSKVAQSSDKASGYHQSSLK